MSQTENKKISSKKRGDILMACVMLVVFTAFLVASFSFGPRARLVPIPVAISGIMLILLDQIFTRVIKQRIAVDSDNIFAKNTKVNVSGVKVQRTNQGRESVALLLVAGLMLLVWIFGILGGIFIFVTGFFRYRNKASVAMSLVWGVGTTASLYIVFGLFLQVLFYQGVLLTPIFGKVAG